VTTLRYRGYHVDPGELAVDECTVRQCDGSTFRMPPGPGRQDGVDYWRLWFRVTNAVDGTPFIASVPINPNGSYAPDGPGGKTWGLTRSGPNMWQVAPSINVLAHGEVHPGEHPSPSMWHQTPTLVDVPDGEAWQTPP